MRDERKFDGITELIKQIHKDADIARKLLLVDRPMSRTSGRQASAF
ncbi:MAG: riboflavin kinase [Desulfovibrio sp.]|nr:riboflavin kinase [Desulfovibrio sp.]